MTNYKKYMNSAYGITRKPTVETSTSPKKRKLTVTEKLTKELAQSDVRDLVKDTLHEAESTADKDMKGAIQVQRRLMKSLLSIDSNMKEIERLLSSFNAPGLKAAYLDSIKKSLRGNKFDIKGAIKHLEKYYKR